MLAMILQGDHDHHSQGYVLQSVCYGHRVRSVVVLSGVVLIGPASVGACMIMLITVKVCASQQIKKHRAVAKLYISQT